MSPEAIKSAVYATVTGRHSTRRFLPEPVTEGTLREILAGASRAASGMNMQPWLVHVVTGEKKQALSKAMREVASSEPPAFEYPYLPEAFKEPYKSRRRKIGFDLYERYGIDKDDMDARKEAMLRNYDFFGAPVGLFFVLDRSMAMGSWLDCGMFMQNVMVLARAHGLETCPQQAWCDYGEVVHRELGISNDYILLSGMALGVEDKTAPENQLVSERAPVDDFTTWYV